MGYNCVWHVTNDVPKGESGISGFGKSMYLSIEEISDPVLMERIHFDVLRKLDEEHHLEVENIEHV